MVGSALNFPSPPVIDISSDKFGLVQLAQNEASDLTVGSKEDLQNVEKVRALLNDVFSLNDNEEIFPDFELHFYIEVEDGGDLYTGIWRYEGNMIGGKLEATGDLDLVGIVSAGSSAFDLNDIISSGV